MAISLRQLAAFAEIARAGTLRQAAERLFLSQPALSMALAELERLLGEPLFERYRRRLLLNERGRELLPLAEAVLAQVRDIELRLERSDGALRGELRIGASNTIGNYLVREMLQGFVAAHPEVHISLEVDNTAAIAARLDDFSLDIAFIEGPPHRRDVQVTPWRADRLVVFAPAGHPLGAKRALRPHDLDGARWVLREKGSATRELFEHAASGQIENIAVALELGQSEAIKQAVLAGLGLGCISELALADELESGQLVVLPTPFLDLRRWLYLATHRHKHRGAVLGAFIENALLESQRASNGATPH